MLLLTALALLAPQDPPFPDGPARSTVVDPAGRPIAGAGVRLEYRPRPHDRFGMAHRHAVATMPLPSLPTASDGGFVLPLSRDQRRLGLGEGTAFWLVVEAAGRVPWQEPLAQGLRGFLGSRVVLPPVAPDETLELIDADALRRPGALFQVVLEGEDVTFPPRHVPVPGQGPIALWLPLRPHPPVLPGRGETAFRTRVRYLHPGHSSEAVRVAPGRQRWEAAPVATRRVTVQAADGGRPEGLRGLYTLPGGSARWFPGADGVLAGDEACTLRAVIADGHRLHPVEGDAGRIVLEPLPAEPVSALRVVDGDGAPIAGARVRAFPIEQVPGTTPGHVPVRPWRRGRTDGDGVWRIDTEQPPVLTVKVRAKGFRSRTLQPAWGREPLPVVLEPAPTGRITLAVRGEDGPAARAAVLLSDSAYAAGGRPGRPPATDAAGKVVLDHLPEGEHDVLIVTEDHAATVRTVRVGSGGPDRIDVQLAPGRSHRVVVRDEDDEPVPFAPLHWQDPPEGRRRNLHADALGRLWLRGVPAGEDTRLSAAGHRHHDQRPLAGDDPDVVQVPSVHHVAVEMPPGSRVWRTVERHGNGGATTSGRPPSGPGWDRVGKAWTDGPGTELRLGLNDGPPVIVRTSDLPPGAGDRGWTVLYRRRVVRRIPLEIEAWEGAPLRNLRLEPRSPHHGGVMVSTRIGSLVEWAGDGTPFLVARDTGAMDGVALLPGAAMLRFRVGAREDDGGEEPLVLRFERRARVELEVTLDRPVTDEEEVRLTVKKKGGGYELYAQDGGRVLSGARPDRPFTFPCPIGLAAGEYTVELRAHGKERSATFEVGTGDEPATVVLH